MDRGSLHGKLRNLFHGSLNNEIQILEKLSPASKPDSRPSVRGNGGESPEPDVQAAVDKREISAKKDGPGKIQCQIVLAGRYNILFFLLQD
jgi:hypothetical protein